VSNLNKLIRKLIQEILNEDLWSPPRTKLPSSAFIKRPSTSKQNPYISDLKPVFSKQPVQKDILTQFSEKLNEWWNKKPEEDKKSFNTAGSVWNDFIKDNKDFANEKNISLLNNKIKDVRNIIEELLNKFKNKFKKPYGQLNEKNRKHFIRRRGA
jgi:hypothetical protein